MADRSNPDSAAHPKASAGPGRREGRREALVEAAERRIAEAGADSLRARDLAQDIGVALGAIYNLVADLDELAFLVAGRTLLRLDAALDAAVADAPSPADALVAVARAYLGFARANTGLWRGLFALPVGEGRAQPAWMAEERARLFRHILVPLEALRPRASDRERRLFAHTLFTAAHGIVQLGLEQRLFAVPPEEIEGQLDLLIRAVCAGLAATA